VGLAGLELERARMKIAIPCSLQAQSRLPQKERAPQSGRSFSALLNSVLYNQLLLLCIPNVILSSVKRVDSHHLLLLPGDEARPVDPAQYLHQTQPTFPNRLLANRHSPCHFPLLNRDRLRKSHSDPALLLLQLSHLAAHKKESTVTRTVTLAASST
jgi:hypothetical protein